MNTHTLDELKRFVDRCHGRMVTGEGIEIYLPTTRNQQRKGLSGDIIREENVQVAFDKLANWEELNQLRDIIKKADVKAFVQKQLSEKDSWAIKALQLIYSYQTATEKQTEHTSIKNCIGFSGSDAELLTSFAKQFDTKKWLSNKQLTIIKKRMKKYWKQIIDASDELKLLRQVKASLPQSIQIRLEV